VRASQGRLSRTHPVNRRTDLEVILSAILAEMTAIRYIVRQVDAMTGAAAMGRRTAIEDLDNRVRDLRQAAGLSQAELAERAGVTRQAVSAIEAGQYLPNTAVALRLSRALGCVVEDLFRLRDISQKLRARVVAASGGDAPSEAGGRVQLARVGDQVVARPLDGPAGFAAAADGIVETVANEGRSVEVSLLIDPETVDHSVVVLGCDPSLALLGQHVQRRFPTYRVLWRHAGSLAALCALRHGEAHVAGTHLWDPETGESNLPAVRRELAGMPVLVVALSQWQQGLLVAAGNPKRIRSVADLARVNVSIVNREPGSGSRALLDYHLEAADIPLESVTGYERLRRSHAEVAEAVRHGLADAGPGILATARAYDLDFVPLQEERYDLVVPADLAETAPVAALLDTVTSRHYRRELDVLGGYDSAIAGALIATIDIDMEPAP
jgi:putative molybdopterin biosynthesis protein